MAASTQKALKTTHGTPLSQQSDQPSGSALDDMTPEEQVVNNVSPLKDRCLHCICPDVHSKAKRSPTAAFVRRQSEAPHPRVQLFTPGWRTTPPLGQQQHTWDKADA